MVSDLHVDIQQNYTWCENNLHPIEGCNILLVAGDTCHYSYAKRKLFVNTVFSRFKTVIEIPGNHDNYTLSKLWNYASHVKVLNECSNNSPQLNNNHYYLNNDFIDIDNVRIIGTTLWSEIRYNYSAITNRLNDYYYIRGFSTMDSNIRFYSACNKLIDIIESTPLDMKIIVMTHHLPLFELVTSLDPINHPIDETLNEAYASNMSDFMRNYSSRISYWLHGHNHDFINTKLFDTTFIRNPLGYLIKPPSSFQPNFFVEL